MKLMTENTTMITPTHSSEVEQNTGLEANFRDINQFNITDFQHIETLKPIKNNSNMVHRGFVILKGQFPQSSIHTNHIITHTQSRSQHFPFMIRGHQHPLRLEVAVSFIINLC